MSQAISDAVASLRRAETKAASLPRAYKLNLALYALAVLGLGLVAVEVRHSHPTARAVRTFPGVETTVAGAQPKLSAPVPVTPAPAPAPAPPAPAPATTGASTPAPAAGAGGGSANGGAGGAGGAAAGASGPAPAPSP